MAGLAYSRPNPDKIAPGIEALLRKELGSSTPLPYQILPGEGESATTKSVLSDIGKAMIMTKQQSSVLFYVHFALNVPRPFELQVSVTRYGLGALVGRFAYAVPLNKPVQGAVSLEATKLGSFNGFSGNAVTKARLNSSRDLIIQAHKLAVSKTTIGKFKLSIPHHVEVVPYKFGSLLILDRLCVPGFFSGANVGAKDLFAFVPQLEASL
jgi:hypothetical protein